jgi:hypothetical protein
MILSGDFLYQISSKSLKKYGNCGWKFIYALTYSMSVTAPIFTKLTLDRQPIPKNFMKIQHTVYSLMLGRAGRM